MDNPRPYKTLFFGQLKQLTDLSTGGTDLVSNIDMPLALDGKNQPVLKGTSLAGALLYTLRKLGHKIPPELAIETELETDQKKKLHLESLWSINNAYLANNSGYQLQLRQYVKIDPSSGAADHGSLFDMQVICAPNNWFFFIEVDTLAYATNTFSNRETYPLSAEQLIATALLNWQQEGVLLGRRSVAGTGWFALESFNCLKLDTTAFELWPNNSIKLRSDLDLSDPSSTLLALKNNNGVEEWEPTKWRKEITQTLLRQVNDDQNHASPNAKPGLTTPFRLEYDLTLTAGPRVDKNDSKKEWGLDSVMIGGHSAMELEAMTEFGSKNTWQDKFSWPSDYPFQIEQDLPDSLFVYDANKDPFIPGSSIRGILHHQIRRDLSHTENAEQQLIDLFGSEEQSSRLFIKDATLNSKGDWQGLIFHNHAEDDFTAGPYESSKFVRCAIAQGSFHGKIILEANSQTTLNDQKTLLENALKLGEHNQLAIGAKQWVDSGWLTWQFTQSQPPEQKGKQP